MFTDRLIEQERRVVLHCHLCGHRWGVRLDLIDRYADERPVFACARCLEERKAA